MWAIQKELPGVQWAELAQGWCSWYTQSCSKEVPCALSQYPEWSELFPKQRQNGYFSICSCLFDLWEDPSKHFLIPSKNCYICIDTEWACRCTEEKKMKTLTASEILGKTNHRPELQVFLDLWIWYNDQPIINSYSIIVYFPWLPA